MIREAKVRILMDAAHDGMKVAVEIDDNDYTAEEVLSAWFTLAATAMQAALMLGATTRSVRGAVEQLLLRIPGDEQPN